MARIRPFAAALSLVASLHTTPASAELAILDLDPTVIGPTETQAYVKIQNSAGNAEITLKVFRLEPREEFVDGLKSRVNAVESRIDRALVVKKSWFAGPPGVGDHRFKLVLLDQKATPKASREFVVQTDERSFNLYQSNPVAWIRAKSDWNVDDAALFHGTLVYMDSTKVTISYKAAEGEKRETVPYKMTDPKKAFPTLGTRIDLLLFKTGREVFVGDFTKTQ